MPAFDLFLSKLNELSGGPIGAHTTDCIHRDRIDIEPGHESVRSRETSNSVELLGIHHVKVVGNSRLNSEMEIPYEPSERSFLGNLRSSLWGVAYRYRNIEPFRTDPESVAVISNKVNGFEIGLHDIC